MWSGCFLQTFLFHWSHLEILVDPLQLDDTHSTVTAHLILLFCHRTFQYIDPVLLISFPALTFDNGCCGLLGFFLSIIQHGSPNDEESSFFYSWMKFWQTFGGWLGGDWSRTTLIANNASNCNTLASNTTTRSLKHTAISCNSLKISATHYNALHYSERSHTDSKFQLVSDESFACLWGVNGVHSALLYWHWRRGGLDPGPLRDNMTAVICWVHLLQTSLVLGSSFAADDIYIHGDETCSPPWRMLWCVAVCCSVLRVFGCTVTVRRQDMFATLLLSWKAPTEPSGLSGHL